MLNGLGDHAVIVRRVASKLTSRRRLPMMTLCNYNTPEDALIRGPVRGPSWPRKRVQWAFLTASACANCAARTLEALGRATFNPLVQGSTPDVPPAKHAVHTVSRGTDRPGRPCDSARSPRCPVAPHAAGLPPRRRGTTGWAAARWTRRCRPRRRGCRSRRLSS
jgi:hypothetical protein